MTFRIARIHDNVDGDDGAAAGYVGPKKNTRPQSSRPAVARVRCSHGYRLFQQPGGELDKSELRRKVRNKKKL